MADFGPTPLTPIVARKISRSVSVENPYRVGAALPEMEVRAEEADVTVGGSSLRVASETRARNPDTGALQHHEILPAPREAPRRWSIMGTYDSTTGGHLGEADSVATGRG